MNNETRKKLSTTFMGISIMLSVAWIVGFWLNDPNPEWAKIARGLVLPFITLGVVFSAERTCGR